MAKTKRVCFLVLVPVHHRSSCCRMPDQYQMLATSMYCAAQRKKRTHVEQVRDPAKKAEPRSFVFWRGKHGVRVCELLLHRAPCAL